MFGRKNKSETNPVNAEQKRYVNRRTVIGMVLMLLVIIVSITVIARQRLKLTNDQLYETNRTRIQTVMNGLDAGIMEKDDLYKEYDQVYNAKLRNTQFYYDSFKGQTFDNAFAREVAEYTDVDSVAVIDETGKAYGSWHCDYDFTKKRFSMLRACDQKWGLSEPFSVAYEEGTRRFFAKEVTPNHILVLAPEWTETEKNIAGMTSWEAVLRGMVSVDTVSIAVSLKDYSFLYNPLDDLTGRDALQNGVPIEALGESYEGELTFEGDTWCAVGRQWNDAVVFVMTRESTDLANDMVLIFFIAIVFIIFVGLVSAYGIIINRDNIHIGRMPSYITLIRSETEEEGRRNILNFNLSVARKLFPIALMGILVVTGMSYYVQSLNGLASIAYESNQAIEEIGKKLENNISDAEAANTGYKKMFLTQCIQLAKLVEENPQYVFNYDIESEQVHRHPTEEDPTGQVASEVDGYGNPLYASSEQDFLVQLCDINAVEEIYVFDELGRVMATSGDNWYFSLSSDKEAQSYPFWEILAEHHDTYTQDLELDDSGEYSQYIGSACYYYTVQNEDGSTGYVSRSDYESQLAGTWTGEPIRKHRGLLQISIAPERLRSVMDTATMTYVADHTTIHGTGYTVICDSDDAHTCIYSPNESDIGRTASSMGYGANCFNESGEMYNGFETVNGVNYFQTFKLVNDYNYYIGTAVPLSTVFFTRDEIALSTLLVTIIGLLIIFVYTCVFGEQEEKFYIANATDPEWHMRNTQDLVTVTMPSGKTRRVRTAASRWDTDEIPWWSKTPEQKFSSILKMVFFVFADFLFICILLSRAGIISIDAINYVYEGVWTKGFNVFALTNGVITLIVAFVLANAAEMFIENVSVNLGSRAETLGHLFSSVIRYGVALFAVFYILYLCGLDTGSLIASAGIMSLVIGLGAQSMIQDILAGVFIVFEGAFRVGDIVTIGDFRGNVLEIGLRTTKIEDPSQNIKVFNNSNLSGIINMTKEASYAGIDVGVAYGVPIERVEAALDEELPKVAKRLPSIMDGPYYKGVSALSDSSVQIKVIALCKEQDRIQLTRDLNRELLVIFRNHGIDIPFPQVTLSYLEKADPPTAKERAEARRFVAEQKEKSKYADVDEEKDN